MDIPRRAQVDRLVPAEIAIHDAIRLVEEMGCDVRLTRAVILLGKAKGAVADYVDGVDPNVGRLPGETEY